MNRDLTYRIALTRIPHVGDVHARTLIRHFGNAADVFSASRAHLEKIEGIGTIRAQHIRSFKDFDQCEKEIESMRKSGIRAIFITESEYPQRLMQCHDAPVLLYVKGKPDLNAGKMIGIVGTRNNNEYGQYACSRLVEGLRDHEATIVSGLAYGIDTIAHKAALANGMPTIAVLAHGLDRVYPWANRKLAEDMIGQGGLISDLGTGTAPDRQHFPRRNRIVAGLCDVVVVVQTGISGGSMITAELANSYNRDVCALPGRIDDERSGGCHALIRDHKAALITGPGDLISMMGWDQKKSVRSGSQRKLFIELSPEEEKVTSALGEKELHIDELYATCRLSMGQLAAALLALEIKSVIKPLPGKRFRML